MSVHAFISWEIQDNVKLRTIISQSIKDPSSNNDVKEECPSPDLKQPKQFVHLRPFQHPELTNCGACHSGESSCELRLVCHQVSGQLPQESGKNPSGGIFFHSVSLDATANLTEVWNSRDYATPVSGVPVGGGWCRFLYAPIEPSSELRFKFLSHATAGSLKLANIRLILQSLSQLDSEPIEEQSQKHQQSHQPHAQQPVNPPPEPAERLQSTPQSVPELFHWLESRLELIERRMDDRLGHIEAKLNELVHRADRERGKSA